MKARVAYDDAVDLLDADHQAVKKMFIDHAALCEDGAPVAAKRLLAQRIVQALTIHAQLEEEIFYPQVRSAIGDDALMNEAMKQHAEVDEAMARIESKAMTEAAHDDAVRQLGMLVDQHVLEERGWIFLKARRAALDLRGLTLALVKRQQQLRKSASAAQVKEAA